MALQDLLTGSIIKEQGGKHGAKGHEFQRYWALCHLLELDLNGSDYVILLEVIEDVAVLDSENNPAAIDLFQVKKKEGKATKWTETSLVKPPKDGKSVLSKIYESKRLVGDELKSIAFVSNAPVELSLSDLSDSLSHPEFSGTAIHATVKASICKAIAAELSCAETEIAIDDLKFIKSPLAMNDLENHATGIVASFLSKKFGDHNARADILCKALYCEVKVRASSTEASSSFADLKRIRGISRS